MLGVAELPPQIADVDLQVVLVVELVAQDRIEDETTGEDPAWMGHEEEQELELLRGQLDRLAVHCHDAAFTTEDELASLQDRCLRRAAAPRHSVDSGDELLEVERLDEVVVCARLQ